MPPRANAGNFIVFCLLDKTKDYKDLITIRLGFVIIYLNQSSERNMIDIPGCSERTNFKSGYSWRLGIGIISEIKRSRYFVPIPHLINK
jgi:hypothetical protein